MWRRRNSPTIAPSFALKPHKHGISSGHEVVLLHRPAEGVAERLDDLRVVRPRGVVEGQRLPTVARPGDYWRLYAVDSEAGRNRVYL